MKIKRIAQWLGLAAAAFFSATAYSQAYVGATLGSTDAKDFCELRTSSCDKTGTAWRVFGGHYFTPNLGLEAGFTDLGRVTDTEAGSNIKVESRAGELLALIAFRARGASVFAKVGGYYAGTKLTVTTGSATTQATESNGGLVYGLGAQVNVTRRLALRGDWHRYAKVGGTSTGGETDIDTFMLGVAWNFR